MLNNLILQLMTLGLNILFVVTVIINNLMFLSISFLDIF